MDVVDVALDDLRPHPRNPRKITPARLEQLSRTLEAERDMLRARPVIALPDGTVVAGNQRLAAARALGWESIPTVYADLDERQHHEDILYGWVPGPGRSGRGKHGGSRWRGDHSQTTVLEVPRPKRSTEHPTMKPVELIEAALANSSVAGDAVLDLFAGSGSTMVACETAGRVALCMEIDPTYCDVIRQRYADYVNRPDLAP